MIVIVIGVIEKKRSKFVHKTSNIEIPSDE
jgi:hypothetical protein